MEVFQKSGAEREDSEREEIRVSMAVICLLYLFALLPPSEGLQVASYPPDLPSRGYSVE